MAEITYGQIQEHLVRLATATAAEEATARERFERLNAKVVEAERNYRAIEQLGFDPLTLHDFQQVGGALVGQARAVAAAANSAIELNGMARTAGLAIERRHGGFDRAAASAPVPPAHRDAYNNRL
ncbi:hypothetical protein ABZ747_18020 [Kitasatospora cineracea]|uniref:hypothetical protein n=1 Tax=Kitasatospora cineracea TaxID=88074 RepID=UPI0033FD6235